MYSHTAWDNILILHTEVILHIFHDHDIKKQGGGVQTILGII